MKKNYMNPSATVIEMDQLDVIATSLGGSEDNVINRATYYATGGTADKVGYNDNIG